jgi:Family of unknown function (DUF5681)
MMTSDEADRPKEETSEGPYKVGDKRPPLHSQFKPGVSGNPKGRPKGSVNFLTMLAAELKSPIKIQEAGKAKTISKQQAMIKQFVTRAVKGDEKAFAKLIPLILTIGAQELSEMGQALSDEQKFILERNARRLLEALADKDGDQ